MADICITLKVFSQISMSACQTMEDVNTTVLTQLVVSIATAVKDTSWTVTCSTAMVKKLNVMQIAALVMARVQMWTSVLRAWTCVPLMPLAPTLRETTTAHVTLDTREMGSHATVRDVTTTGYMCDCTQCLQILTSVLKGLTPVMLMPHALTVLAASVVNVTVVTLAMDITVVVSV